MMIPGTFTSLAMCSDCQWGRLVAGGGGGGQITHSEVSDLEWVGVRPQENLHIVNLLPFWPRSGELISCLLCCFFKLSHH